MTRVALVLMLAVAAVVAATSSAGSRPRRLHARIVVNGSLPQSLHQGDVVTVDGRVVAARRARTVLFEGDRGSGWAVLARSAIRRGRFSVSWTVPARYPLGMVRLRLVARRGRRTATSTRPVQSTVSVTTGPPPDACAAAAAPVSVPPGDGWITGGEIFQGGPYPGRPRCSSRAYTVTATASDGSVAAMEHVAAGQSYTLVVPAGTYALRADACRGTATVHAGQRTQADTPCAVP